MELTALTEVIDELFATGSSEPVDGETVEALQRQLARLDAFATSAASRFDASGEWSTDGARTAAAWIATRCRLPKGQARRIVRRGRQLRSLPTFAQAWSDGAISAAHVDAIGSVSRPATSEALGRDEELLAGHARTLRFDSFSRALAYWEQFADPDGAEESDEKRRSRRNVSLVESLDGMWFGRMILDPITGTIVAGELERLEQTLFEADWSEARDRLGREPTVAELRREPDQRRADAMAEMAIRSKSAPSHGRRPTPLFTVLVDFETIHGRICELAGGSVVSPGSLLPWLDGADIERVVFGPGRRAEVGRTARFFTGATRRAIELRDRECTHPYCNLRYTECEVDHIQPYSRGGLTTQENGRILCGFHNRLRNQRPPPDSDP